MLTVACLCPTFRRRRLLENAVACFEAQSYPAEFRRLLICDDSGEALPQRGDGWELLPADRFASLPEKYNFLAEQAIQRWHPDVLCVWEDDDVYLVNYVANHAAAFQGAIDGWVWNKAKERWESKEVWSQCSWVWTDGSGGENGGGLRRENTGFARLHGCLAMSRLLYERIGGWPVTARMDFDLQMLARLRSEMYGPLDPCQLGPSQYFFRWASTGQPHGQSYCTGPGDEQWLEKAQAAFLERYGRPVALGCLKPKMDDETTRLYANPPV